MTGPDAPAPPAVPALGDTSLHLVQSIEHELDAGFRAMHIAGLDGDLMQRSSRGSHRVRIHGLLAGDSSLADLAALQQAAAGGDEVTFTADITTALDLQRVVVTSFRALAVAGAPGRYEYDLEVVESPPLPPPAETSAFGGLGDFGLGDLGLDPGVLDQVSALADEAGGLADLASSALGAVSSLAGGLLSGLGGIGSPSGLLQPLSGAVGSVQGGGEQIASAGSAFSGVIG